MCGEETLHQRPGWSPGVSRMPGGALQCALSVPLAAISHRRWFIKKLQKRTQKNIEICVQKGVGFPKQNSDFLECPKANLNKSTGGLSIVLS